MLMNPFHDDEINEYSRLNQRQGEFLHVQVELRAYLCLCEFRCSTPSKWVVGLTRCEVFDFKWIILYFECLTKCKESFVLVQLHDDLLPTQRRGGGDRRGGWAPYISHIHR